MRLSKTKLKSAVERLAIAWTVTAVVTGFLTAGDILPSWLEMVLYGILLIVIGIIVVLYLLWRREE